MIDFLDKSRNFELALKPHQPEAREKKDWSFLDMLGVEGYILS